LLFFKYARHPIGFSEVNTRREKKREFCALLWRRREKSNKSIGNKRQKTKTTKTIRRR